MEHRLVCVDVETSSSTPMSGAMLAIGACIVYERDNRFYRELKPDNDHYDMEVIRVACKGLECLDEVRHLDIYNPENKRFRPELALYRLKTKGRLALTAMTEFRDWVKDAARGHVPVLIADPAAFDAMWIHCYFDKYCIENPFRHGGKDVNSLYEGMTGKLFADISSSDFWPAQELPHHGLEDALITAEAVEKLLDKIKKRR